MVRGRKYRSFSDAMMKMYKYEGFSSFYRGLIANYMKNVPMVSVSFAIFEYTK